MASYSEKQNLDLKNYAVKADPHNSMILIHNLLHGGETNPHSAVFCGVILPFL